MPIGLLDIFFFFFFGGARISDVKQGPTLSVSLMGGDYTLQEIFAHPGKKCFDAHSFENSVGLKQPQSHSAVSAWRLKLNTH